MRVEMGKLQCLLDAPPVEKNYLCRKMSKVEGYCTACGWLDAWLELVNQVELPVGENQGLINRVKAGEHESCQS